MTNIPAMSGREVIRTFEKLGWRVDRRRGSHVVMLKADEAGSLIVPEHKEVRKGTLRSLIQDAGLTVDEFKAAR